MKGHIPISLPVALLVLAFFMLAGLAPPVPTGAGQEPANSAGREKWAVILSPGPQDGVPWGGYHATIAGYSETNGGDEKAESLRRAFTILFHGEPWHLHGALPALETWKGRWTQTFNSRILDELANRLQADGFDLIKGPIRTRTAWHISMLGNYSASQAEIESLKKGKTDWYLWQVPEPPKACIKHGRDCPPWNRID